MTTYHASCHCGQLSLSFTKAPMMQLVCHCNDCREASAEPFMPCVFFASEANTISGESRDEQAIGGSGQPKHNHYCTACGDFIYVVVDALQGSIAVNGKALRAPFQFKPTAHVWISQKLAEVSIPNGVLVFERRPSLKALMPPAPTMPT
ncbi:MAG: GFA family protein [Paraperlucidibaca sp.]